MKLNIKSGIALMLSLFSLAATAQDLNTAYFTKRYQYRHQMNPAFDNDSLSYFAVPALGNIGVSVHSSFGVKDIIFDNPMYPNRSHRKLTTFMNPYIPADQALAGLDKGDNKIINDEKIGIIAFGWKGWGGYNTFDVNLRTSAGITLPYELFEFAKNTGNKRYDIGNIGLQAQGFVELALGHSHNITEQLRIGAKLKFLVGAARADFYMKDVVADLSADNKWTIQGDAQAEVSMKGFSYKSETKQYDSKPGQYEYINDVDVDGAGVGGFGMAVDLGATYKIMDNLTVSAALLDLGYINWSNDIYATNSGKTFEFAGFHDIDVSSKDAPNSLSNQADKYKDQIADFANLQDRGDQGSRKTSLGATLNLGAEYALPMYDKLSFGLLATKRFHGDYSWSETRLSANWAPAKPFSCSLSAATGTFGTTTGWALSLHNKGLGLFLGMDYLLGSLSKDMVPLGKNQTLNLGLNFSW